jgi:hypothetical protein
METAIKIIYKIKKQFKYMKTKIFGGIAILAIALAMAFNVSLNTGKSKNTSLLALANVEALASGEGSSSDCETYCTSDSRYDCIISWGAGIEGVTCPDHRKK